MVNTLRTVPCFYSIPEIISVVEYKIRAGCALACKEFSRQSGMCSALLMLIVNGFLYSFLWKFPKPALNVDIKKGPDFTPIPHFPRYISKFNSAIILIICIGLQLHHLIRVLIQIPPVADI